MKRVLAALALTLLLTVSFVSAEDAKADPLAAERAAIEACARDYIDGWFEGNAERMARALHPDLAKRSATKLPNGLEVLRPLSHDMMVAYTKNGFGPKSKKDGQVNEVIILDVHGTMASVKTIAPQFVDYLHLAKINGEWRIINVFWVPGEAR